MGQLKEKIDIRGKLVQRGGLKLTDKEREELKQSELGFFLNAATDPKVTQEEISNAVANSLVGKGLQAFAIGYKKTGGGATQTEWGDIGGHLTAQTDLVNALSAKASLPDLAAIDTRTRALENTIATKADQSALDAKANTTDVEELQSALNTLQTTVNSLSTTVQGKANTTDVEELQSALNTLQTTVNSLSTIVQGKANTTDVEELFAQMTTVVNEKASAPMWSNVEIPVSGWSASAPYTQTVTVNGVLATYNPDVDIKFTDITDNTAMADEKSYYNCVDHIAMGDNSITLICLDEKPAGTFHIKMREVS